VAGKRPAKHCGRPVEEYVLHVAEEEAALRLDQFLARRMPWRSRTFFQGMVARGEVVLNQQQARASTPVRCNDVIIVDISRYQQPYTAPAAIPLDILVEDDDLLVLNKPPGVVVHPTGIHLYDTLLNAIHARYHDAAYMPQVVHRLDKETSGVLVCVKNEQARTRLALEIEGRRVVKLYRALVHGVPTPRTGEITLPLGGSRHSHIRLKQDVTPQGGLPAHTLYRVEASAPVVPGLLDGISLVRAQLMTGRTHQIRVHMAAIGHPVLADKLYGRETRCCIGALTITSHMLHAWRYTFAHPRTRVAVTVTAPLPETFAACVRQCFGELDITFD
jgi:23S rRNA pseudouridine1911/1915/1917 synthase